MKKLSKNISYFFLPLLLMACSSSSDQKDITPLNITQKMYSMMENWSQSIYVNTGSGDLSLKVEDASVVEATYQKNTDGTGNIIITGKKKGSCSLVVTDNATQVKQDLSIKVTDRYLSYHIYDSDHPTLANDVVLFLVANDAHSCYFFPYSYTKSGSTMVVPLAKGTYSFSKETSGSTTSYLLNLTFPTDAKGKFTTDASVSSELHSFSMSGNTGLTLLNQFFSLNWNTATVDTKTSPSAVYTLTLSTTKGSYVITGNLEYLNNIPEGTLE
jgi:hypothetical protein